MGEPSTGGFEAWVQHYWDESAQDDRQQNGHLPWEGMLPREAAEVGYRAGLSDSAELLLAAHATLPEVMEEELGSSVTAENIAIAMGIVAQKARRIERFQALVLRLFPTVKTARADV